MVLLKDWGNGQKHEQKDVAGRDGRSEKKSRQRKSAINCVAGKYTPHC